MKKFKIADNHSSNCKVKCQGEVQGLDHRSGGSKSTLPLWRVMLNNHRRIVTSIADQSLIHVSRQVQVGPSLVTARLSIFDDIWSLDISYPPLGENKGGNQGIQGLESSLDNSDSGQFTSLIYSPLDKEVIQEMTKSKSCYSHQNQNQDQNQNPSGFVSDGEVALYSDSDMASWLDTIIAYWPPLCSTSSSHKTKDVCFSACKMEARRASHENSFTDSIQYDSNPYIAPNACTGLNQCNGLNSNCKSQYAVALSCRSDGLAMQYELLRLLRVCPISFTAALTACDRNTDRSQRCGGGSYSDGNRIANALNGHAVGGGDGDDSTSDSVNCGSGSGSGSDTSKYGGSDSSSNGNIPHDGNTQVTPLPLALTPTIRRSSRLSPVHFSVVSCDRTINGSIEGDHVNSNRSCGREMKIDCHPLNILTDPQHSPRSEALEALDTSTNIDDMNDKLGNEPRDNLGVVLRRVTPGDRLNIRTSSSKKKIKGNVGVESKVGSGSKADDITNSKLEGVVKGRVKFCTNLDMSKWDNQMQVQ